MLRCTCHELLAQGLQGGYPTAVMGLPGGFGLESIYAGLLVMSHPRSNDI